MCRKAHVVGMSKTAPSKVPAESEAVIVTIDPSFSVDDLVEEMRRVGFRVREKMAAISVVSGDGSPRAIATMRKLPGVKAISADSIVKLDPREVPDLGSGFVTGSSWRSPSWED